MLLDSLDHVDPLDFERQITLEAEMTSRGTAAFEKQMTEARLNGQETTTPLGSYLVRRAIKPVADAIRTFLEAAASGRPGLWQKHGCRGIRQR